MRPDRIVAHACAWAAVAVCGGVSAQLVPQIDWQEVEAPPPPAVQVERLVPIEMRGSSMRWGVDPASIQIGADGVVRYVVVTQGEGSTVNALYEGVRCSTAEVKTYARHAGSGWVPVQSADWKTLFGGAATRHSLLIARGGACQGNAPASDAQRVARDLRGPGGRAFYQTP